MLQFRAASRLAFIQSVRLLTYQRPHRYLQPLQYSPPSERLISSSSSRHNSESDLPSPAELRARLGKTKAVQKIQDSPEAMEAMQALMQVLQKEGVDLSTGKPPSVMTMMKLGMKKDVREALTTVGETLRKIGVDPSDKATIDEFMQAMKKD